MAWEGGIKISNREKEKGKESRKIFKTRNITIIIKQWKITRNKKKASRMKHGWCQTTNNTVCCYQSPFNIALILEQVSNYNSLLR